MSQHTTVLAQQVGELIVAALAQEIITLDKELAELDRPDQREGHRTPALPNPAQHARGSDLSSRLSSPAPQAESWRSFKPLTGLLASQDSPPRPGTPAASRRQKPTSKRSFPSPDDASISFGQFAGGFPNPPTGAVKVG